MCYARSIDYGHLYFGINALTTVFLSLRRFFFWNYYTSCYVENMNETIRKFAKIWEKSWGLKNQMSKVQLRKPLQVKFSNWIFFERSYMSCHTKRSYCYSKSIREIQASFAVPLEWERSDCQATLPKMIKWNIHNYAEFGIAWRQTVCISNILSFSIDASVYWWDSRWIDASFVTFAISSKRLMHRVICIAYRV